MWNYAYGMDVLGNRNLSPIRHDVTLVRLLIEIDMAWSVAIEVIFSPKNFELFGLIKLLLLRSGMLAIKFGHSPMINGKVELIVEFSLAITKVAAALPCEILRVQGSTSHLVGRLQNSTIHTHCCQLNKLTFATLRD